MEPISGIGGILGRVKSAGILIGLLYLLAFVVLLPPMAAMAKGSIGGIAELFAVGIVAVIVVQILLNWATVAIVAAPIVAAVVLVVGGWGIWLFAPLAALPVNVIVGMVGSFLPGANSATSDISLLVDFISRAGQTLIALGGAFWWVARRLGKVNQLAIGVYIVSLGLLGILSGVLGLGPVMVFLLIWLVIYMKISNEKSFSDLQRIFQVVATVALLVNMGVFHGVLSSAGGAWQSLSFGSTGASTGAVGFARTYEVLLDVLLLLGVWNPLRFWGWVPKGARNFLLNKVNSAMALLRLPS